MSSRAPSSAAVATPWRRCPLPTKLQAIRQSGGVVTPFSYSARLLIRGSSVGAPNWHQPRQSSLSKTRAACVVPALTRARFRLRLAAAPFGLSWNPIHQQPPKTPLLRSTSLANAAHVDSSKALTVYPIDDATYIGSGGIDYCRCQTGSLTRSISAWARPMRVL